MGAKHHGMLSMGGSSPMAPMLPMPTKLDLGCTIPQITVDYESIPMWWQHVGILLSKTPTVCWMWSGGALIQVSAL